MSCWWALLLPLPHTNNGGGLSNQEVLRRLLLNLWRQQGRNRFIGYFMKKKSIIIICLLCINNVFAQANDGLVLFTKSVQWSSFKGTPDSDTLGARISTSIHLEILKVNVWNGILNFKAYALLNTFKSWVRPAYADQYTLQHEQTHFNLTEMCARGLQAELNQMKLKSKRSTLIQATLTKWQVKLEVLQNQYDFETIGGNNRVAQDIWNKKITTELNVIPAAVGMQ